MIKFFTFFSLVILLSFNSFSQNSYTQTVRGQIVDKVSSVGLPGVVVRLKNDSTKKHVFLMFFS